jgi:hypothetical protein
MKYHEIITLQTRKRMYLNHLQKHKSHVVFYEDKLKRIDELLSGKVVPESCEIADLPLGYFGDYVDV